MIPVSYLRSSIFFGIVCYILPILSETISETIFRQHLETFGIRIPVVVSGVLATLIVCTVYFSRHMKRIFKCGIAGLCGKSESNEVSSVELAILNSASIWPSAAALFVWVILTTFPALYVRKLTYDWVGVGGTWPGHELIATAGIAVFGYLAWRVALKEWVMENTGRTGDAIPN